MSDEQAIRQAVQADTSRIASLLANAAFVHRHLDWQGVLDWIPHAPFLILEQGPTLVGLLACAPDLDEIAWIRCFACAPHHDQQAAWGSLLGFIRQHHLLEGMTLYSVGLNDWFAQMLRGSGFVNFQNIVVLNWEHKNLPERTMSTLINIRPMEEEDLVSVANLDRAAFEPMWVNPPDKIKLAFAQCEHAAVAELDGQILGYEMTTANHFSAHLARIAVHPDIQHRHVGSNLIIDMFRYFKKRGVHQVSVNTQDNNRASLALYHSMGFEVSGETFPVFRLEM